MNIYRLLQPWLQRCDPEWTHDISLKILQFLPQKLLFKKSEQNLLFKPTKIWGLNFPHPVGLAAGVDVSGAYLSGLAKLDLGFIEIGTVTPRGQEGNVKPRMFRLPQSGAIINRMGFNNPGVDALILNLEKTTYSGILGINIGKNKETGLNKAMDDYNYCLRKVYQYADYVTINISSPNTQDLRKLQQDNYFDDFINAIIEQRKILADLYQKQVPIVVKVSPDETDEQLLKMSDIMLKYGIDGIIATNTTIARDKVLGIPYASEIGGLSGRPLAERSMACLHLLRKHCGSGLVLISVGGIDSANAIQERLDAGANLVQVYTGLVYNGLFFRS